MQYLYNSLLYSAVSKIRLDELMPFSYKCRHMVLSENALF